MFRQLNCENKCYLDTLFNTASVVPLHATVRHPPIYLSPFTHSPPMQPPIEHYSTSNMRIYHLPMKSTILQRVHSFIHRSIHSSTDPFIHRSIHSSTDPFIHPPIHSSTDPFIHPPIHSFIHRSIHSSTDPFIHPPIHSFIHRSIFHLSIHSSIYPYVHLSIHSFIYPFVHPSIHPS